MSRSVLLAISVFLGLTITVSSTAKAHEPHRCPGWLPDVPSFSGHIEQHDIVSGKIPLKDVIEHGRRLFMARFNTCDGQGRPATTGTGEKRIADQPEFIRTSSPESDSCAGCHAQPEPGGAGDFVANVFVLAQALDPVTESVSGDFSNERNTLGVFGAGAIEMLAREMSGELQAQAANLPDGEHVLVTKGVEYEVTVGRGAVVASRGVDTDLTIKPFHQSGVVHSLREFTVNAMNHHHGMQAEERFDLVKADTDFDEDGIERELTIGDITAVALFQAALPIPVQVKPHGRAARQIVEQGETLFDGIGCTSCHKHALKLNGTMFKEPDPNNPAGTLNDTSQTVAFEMTKDGMLPRLAAAPGGGAYVHAYTDLKRHNLCDDPGDPDPIRFFCNEQLPQGRPAQDGRPGAEFFLTRKLWDVGNSAPYGHRGDLTTIAEAILMHGGEARASRDAFAALPSAEQRSIVAFLRSLQVSTEVKYGNSHDN